MLRLYSTTCFLTVHFCYTVMRLCLHIWGRKAVFTVNFKALCLKKKKTRNLWWQEEDKRCLWYFKVTLIFFPSTFFFFFLLMYDFLQGNCLLIDCSGLMCTDQLLHYFSVLTEWWFLYARPFLPRLQFVFLEFGRVPCQEVARNGKPPFWCTMLGRNSLWVWRLWFWWWGWEPARGWWGWVLGAAKSWRMCWDSCCRVLCMVAWSCWRGC